MVLDPSCSHVSSCEMGGGGVSDLCNCEEAACVLYCAHKAVLFHSKQLRPGGHRRRSCWCRDLTAILSMLLNEGLQIKHACCPSARVQPAPCSLGLKGMDTCLLVLCYQCHPASAAGCRPALVACMQCLSHDAACSTLLAHARRWQPPDLMVHYTSVLAAHCAAR